MEKYFTRLESSLTCLTSIAAFINIVILSEDLLFFGVSSKYFSFTKSPASAISRWKNYTNSEIQQYDEIGKSYEKLKIDMRLILYK